MNHFKVIFKVLNIILSLLIFVMTAFRSSSDGNVGASYTISFIALALLVLGIISLFKDPKFYKPGIFLIITILFFPFALASLNCARCVPPDIRISTVHIALESYHADKNSYPETLDQIERNPKLDSEKFKYTKKGDSYELCTQIRINYFLGIQISKGDLKCEGPLEFKSKFGI